MLSWKDVRDWEEIHLYAGDIYPRPVDTSHLTGLSRKGADKNHLHHDITWGMPLPECSVDSYQAEDVFEHIEYSKLHAVVDEIWRVLKPGGLFRLSLPDYRCDVLRDRSERDGEGNIVFDPGGGGTKVDPGHLWFPYYERVFELLARSKFHLYEFLHYYRPRGRGVVVKKIDFSLGYISRVPDHDERVIDPWRPLSLVVDCYREEAGSDG